MINTHSLFVYGVEITGDNRYFDFSEYGNDFTITLDLGFRSVSQLLDQLESAMNASSVNVYTISFNRTTRKVTISADGNFDLPVNTGPSALLSVYTTIGINNSVDFTSVTSVAGTSAVSSTYTTQFMLQNYTAPDDFKVQRFATVNESAAGNVQLSTFGQDSFIEFSLKWVTDTKMQTTRFWRNRSNGVAQLRALMEYAYFKYPLEFSPNENDPSTFFVIVLESSNEGTSGSGFKLLEQYERGLVGIFETSVLKWRILE